MSWLLFDIDLVLIFYRQAGLRHEVLQWYICRMEAWFAVDADMISLKLWDQVSEWVFFFIFFSFHLKKPIISMF